MPCEISYRIDRQIPSCYGASSLEEVESKKLSEVYSLVVLVHVEALSEEEGKPKLLQRM